VDIVINRLRMLLCARISKAAGGAKQKRGVAIASQMTHGKLMAWRADGWQRGNMKENRRRAGVIS